MLQKVQCLSEITRPYRDQLLLEDPEAFSLGGGKSKIRYIGNAVSGHQIPEGTQ